MTALRQTRRNLRHAAIVDAAAQVFSDVGLRAATLDQIGARVGLSKASLYYYVESKDQLIADVLKVVLDEIDARTSDLTEPDAGPLEQLKARVTAHVETAFASPAGRLIVANLDALGDTAPAVRLLRAHEDQAHGLMLAAREQGLIRDIDVTSAVKLLYGALNTLPRWHDGGNLDRVIDQTWDIFLGGVAA